MVLKEAKMVHGGLLFTVYVSDGLESSQFCLYTHDCLEMGQFTMLVPNGLERSHLWVVIFSWALALACHCSLYGANGDISARRAESPCESPWSTSQGWMKAGSDWCLFLPSGEESL